MANLSRPWVLENALRPPLDINIDARILEHFTFDFFPNFVHENQTARFAVARTRLGLDLFLNLGLVIL